MCEDNCGISGWGMGRRSQFPRESSRSLPPGSKLEPQQASGIEFEPVSELEVSEPENQKREPTGLKTWVTSCL